jgi:hypothetical protein
VVLPNVIDRAEFLARIKRLGWGDPIRKERSREMFVQKGKRRARIPNDHGKEVYRDDIKDWLRNSGTSEEEWHDAADKHYRAVDDGSEDAGDGHPPRRIPLR